MPFGELKNDPPRMLRTAKRKSTTDSRSGEATNRPPSAGSMIHSRISVERRRSAYWRAVSVSRSAARPRSYQSRRSPARTRSTSSLVSGSFSRTDSRRVASASATARPPRIRCVVPSRTIPTRSEVGTVSPDSPASAMSLTICV